MAPQLRANARIPPLIIELANIGLDQSDPDYANAVNAVNGYHKQAVNMTADEQNDYLSMIQLKSYKIPPSNVGNACNHKVYKQCRKTPTWAKYVFIHSIYEDVRSLHKYIGTLGRLDVDDLSQLYRRYMRAEVDQTPIVQQPSTAFAPIPSASSPASSLATPIPTVQQPSTAFAPIPSASSSATPIATPLAAALNPPTPSPTPRKRRATTQGQRQQAPTPFQQPTVPTRRPPTLPPYSTTPSVNATLNAAMPNAEMPTTNIANLQTDTRTQRVNHTEQRITDNMNARFDFMASALDNVQQTITEFKEDQDLVNNSTAFTFDNVQRTVAQLKENQDLMRADLTRLLSLALDQNDEQSPDPFENY